MRDETIKQVNAPGKSKSLNILVWIAQILLSASFIWAACVKLFQSSDKLTAMWPWTAENTGLVRFTGVLDLLAGLGLVLPQLLNIKPVLTVYTAYAILLLMICATIFHVSRGEV